MESGVELVLLGLVVVGLAVLVALRLRPGRAVSIRSATIRLAGPRAIDLSQPGGTKAHDELTRLVDAEAQLRRSAYFGTPIATGESFYDDSDMKEPYFLIVVYDRRSDTLLLSARYYRDNETIAEHLRGEHADGASTAVAASSTRAIAVRGPSVLLDRMCGNDRSPLYRKYHGRIHKEFHTELVAKNRDRTLFAMARRDPRELLLTKYVRFGLSVVGSTMHRGVEHWILKGDLRRYYRHLLGEIAWNVSLLVRATMAGVRPGGDRR